MKRHFLGVDPGPVPGFCRLSYLDGRLVGISTLQCTAELAGDVAAFLLRDVTGLQLERFVDSSRSGRTSNRGALDDTRGVVSAVTAAALLFPISPVLRRATDVKPWATDVRLVAAVEHGSERSLLTATAGMRHARDAARHALYLACRSGMPDPLSKHA